MKCFMCSHDYFKIELESANCTVFRPADNHTPQITTPIPITVRIWCQQCDTLIWDYLEGWASEDMANIWEWNGRNLVLKDRLPKEDKSVERALNSLTKEQFDKLVALLKEPKEEVNASNPD